jgi:hypothetical protein
MVKRLFAIFAFGTLARARAHRFVSRHHHEPTTTNHHYVRYPPAADDTDLDNVFFFLLYASKRICQLFSLENLTLSMASAVLLT